MKTYNFIITECKITSTFFNFADKEKFFERLWEWTYVDDLWEFIKDTDPTEEELDSYLNHVFIEENIFHGWEEDTVDCFAFTVDDDGITHTYDWDEDLIEFIHTKIKEHYGY